MRRAVAVISVLVVLALGVAFAVESGKYYRVEDANEYVTGDRAYGASSERILTASDVAVTTATVTFSAAEKQYVTLTTNGATTGIYPTGGDVGQVLTIISGAGSDTMRFDDGAKTVLGANITLTEGQSDTLTLICTSANGDVWARLANGDN